MNQYINVINELLSHDRLIGHDEMSGCLDRTGPRFQRDKNRMNLK